MNEQKLTEIIGCDDQELLKLLNSLDEREARIIECRYGLKSCTPKSIEECAKEFNTSCEMIRMTEAKALKKLKVHK